MKCRNYVSIRVVIYSLLMAWFQGQPAQFYQILQHQCNGHDITTKVAFCFVPSAFKKRGLCTYYLQLSKSTKLIFAFEINMVDSSKNNSVKWFKMLWCYYASMHEFKYAIYFIGDLVCFERRLFELLSRGCIVSKTSSFEPKGFLLNKCNSKKLFASSLWDCYELK